MGREITATSLWFPGPRLTELRREPIRSPGPGEVRVRAIASGISHGTEMLVYRGQVPAHMELDLPTLEGSFGFPIKYGYASVGRVEEAGPDAQGVALGDLVFVHHPHQDRYVVPANSVIRLPAGLDPLAGVFLANLETAVNVVLDAAPRLGERVAVFGQGTVGLLVTQLLRRAGTGLLLVVDPVPLRRGTAREVGADVALSPGDGVRDEVLRLTGGAGADIAIEASGNADALNQAIDCVAFQGTVVVCSWYGDKPAALMLGGAFHRKRLRIVSSQVSNLDPALRPRWDRARRMRLALDLLSATRPERLITHRVPFERAGEAYDLVDGHPEEVVQVVLTYGDSDV